MLTENQKTCKHEWYINKSNYEESEKCYHCEISKEEYETYQQGFNEGIDRAKELIEDNKTRCKEHALLKDGIEEGCIFCIGDGVLLDIQRYFENLKGGG